MAEKQWMTYSQIAERLGVTSDAIRHRSRKEGWQRQQGNDGKIRVLMDPELLSEIPSRNGTDSNPESGRNSNHSDQEIRRLEDHLQELRRQTDQLRADHKAEIDRMQAAHAAELERARMDADRARDDSKLMIEQMKDLTDRLDRERQAEADRLRADLEQARAELARARRPWWRRLMGR